MKMHKESIVRNEASEYNIGFCFLRIWMSFEVILVHFWYVPSIDYVPWYLFPFAYMRMLAVPLFMMLSFFLLERTFIARDCNKFKKRIVRLLVPHIGWAVIYFFVFKLP